MLTLIENGTVVTATDTFRGDILIGGERIITVGEVKDVEADNVVDATGCLVLPGLVDNHTHLSMPFGGTVTADDFDTGTAAAAAGGTTSIVDFALQTDGSLLKGLETWQGNAEGSAHIDYGFHLAVSDASDAAIAEMDRAVDEGVSTFKVFMAYKGALMISDDQFLRVLQRSRENGGLVNVHCENGDAIDVYQREALAAGNTAPKFHAVTRPPGVEAEATGRAIRLAEWAGTPLFVVHVTCEESVREIQAARDRGLPIFGETCVHYLFLTVDDLDRPGFEGAKYVCSPPLREARNHEVLWRALRQRALQGCSTDHCPFNYDGQKDLGRDDFTKIPNGLPAIEFRLSLMYDRGVRAGKIGLNDLVRVTSTAPARIFGLAPRKGSLAPGADGDVVVFDPDREITISAATHHMNTDYDPFEGEEVRGAPKAVLSRGEVVFADGEIRSQPGRGRYLRRELFDPVGQGSAPAPVATGG